MAIHIIPDTEPELHQSEPCCPCEPILFLDEQTGEMVWVHQLIDAGRIIDQMLDI